MKLSVRLIQEVKFTGCWNLFHWRRFNNDQLRYPRQNMFAIHSDFTYLQDLFHKHKRNASISILTPISWLDDTWYTEETKKYTLYKSSSHCQSNTALRWGPQPIPPAWNLSNILGRFVPRTPASFCSLPEQHLIPQNWHRSELGDILRNSY